MTPQQIEALVLAHGPKYAEKFRVSLIPLARGYIDLTLDLEDPRWGEACGAHVMDCVREDPELQAELLRDFAGLETRVEYVSNLTLYVDENVSCSTNTDDPKESIGYRLDQLRNRDSLSAEESAQLGALEKQMGLLGD